MNYTIGLTSYIIGFLFGCVAMYIILKNNNQKWRSKKKGERSKKELLLLSFR